MPTSAWDLAHRAAGNANVALRPLTSLEDADGLLSVMVATWGSHDLMPREMVRAFAESGNVPWGAFDGSTLIGYVLGWAGIDPQDGMHVHSHMLASLPDRRHRGVGFALKLAQRAAALEQGLSLIRWTFDPLMARNAHVNVTKLGADCDRFHRDFYGDMSDALNAGDRSDRLVVRWDLAREPGSRPFPPVGGTLVRAVGSPDRPEPEPADSTIGAAGGSGDEAAWIAIPRDYLGLRASDEALARAWRDVVGDALSRCFSSGCRVVAFDADLDGGHPRYALARAPTDRIDR